MEYQIPFFSLTTFQELTSHIWLLASILHIAGLTCGTKKLFSPTFPLWDSSFYRIEISLIKSRLAFLDKGRHTESPIVKGVLTSKGQDH